MFCSRKILKIFLLCDRAKEIWKTIVPVLPSSCVYGLDIDKRIILFLLSALFACCCGNVAVSALS